MWVSLEAVVSCSLYLEHGLHVRLSEEVLQYMGLLFAVLVLQVGPGEGVPQ